ncbi:Kinesin-like protein [Caenorhabditis elegans]|uniref:Kinesin-like protein n=2 Tax=Caenorhabditis elegans TaxID=6239 RepID=Q9XU12_CAEEL|nr:Kinesin-like protein [Caenorhabditis elegans]CAB07264.1 Kinesin-like protein [Caenorhabditis elegans]|eukprot:NP_001022677.1 Kinesin-like protein [Caenorhabditis elegans]
MKSCRSCKENPEVQRKRAEKPWRRAPKAKSEVEKHGIGPPDSDSGEEISFPWYNVTGKMLVVGMHVEIKRSDGRIHGAVIAEVKSNGRFMVEWYEKGETKGKESSLEELLTLNPSLQAPKPTPPPQPPQKTLQASTAVNRQNGIHAQSMILDDEDTFLLDHINMIPAKGASANKRPTGAFTQHVPVRMAPPSEKPLPTRRAPSPKEDAAPAPKSTRTTAAFKPDLDSTAITVPKHTARRTVVVAPAPAPVPAPPIANMTSQRAPSPVARVPSPKNVPRSYPQQDVQPSNGNFAFAEMIRNYRAQIDYRPLSMFDGVNENRISVCVRKRPLNKKELTKAEVDVITIPSRDITILHQPQTRVDLTKYLDNQKFRFDYSFDEYANNELVYRFTAAPLVKTVFDNGTATCFAYGQTGSGKTHTMGGDFSGKKQNASMGIYALTARDVFRMLEQPQYRRKDLSVHCAFFEIYGTKTYDLLNDKAELRVLEDKMQKVQVVGLKEEQAHNEQDVLELINKGTLVRTAGTTSANANSSRSHAIFQIILRQGKKVWGKFSLIDLAGNERGQDTRECDRDTRKEGANINTSLLALKECIRGMARNSSHVPFRQSKLTMVLRDSFIGEKSRTVMISMISPGISSSDHTLNTLRYADRVKEMGTDGSGEATPIRDEELFLPPSADKSDEEYDEMVEKQEHRRVAVDHVRNLKDMSEKIIRETTIVLSNEPSAAQKAECLAKLDQLAQIVSNTRVAVENV